MHEGILAIAGENMRGSGANARAVLRSTLAATIAGVASLGAGPAAADGTPGAPLTVSEYIGVADWSGFYVGGQVGGAWSKTDWQQVNPNYFNSIGAVVIGTGSSFDADGAIGGILGGYNQQIGRWVFGLELAANWTDLSHTRASPFFPGRDVFTAESSFIGSITGRVGYTWDRWQWYAKGGWAYGNAKMSLNDQVAGIVASDDSWANGWIIGGGVEYFLWPSISLGLTYDYIDLDLKGEGDLLNCAGCGALAPALDSDIITQSVMARMSFYFTPED
jgi:outer membrane immunogenic protein